MIKRFAYIVLLLIFASCLSFAASVKNKHTYLSYIRMRLPIEYSLDTVATKKTKQQQQEEEKKKIKEIAKAKHQVRPEKVDEQTPAKPKSKRERRPEGMERPPEIPRRNGN